MAKQQKRYVVRSFKNPMQRKRVYLVVDTLTEESVYESTMKEWATAEAQRLNEQTQEAN